LPCRCLMWSTPQYRPLHPDYTRPTCNLLTTVSGGGLAHQSLAGRQVAGWQSSLFREFLVFRSTYHARKG
jgi:hypothetical protein